MLFDRNVCALNLIGMCEIHWSLIFMPPFKERAYCFAHVGRSVCPSVTFSFPINNLIYLPQTLSWHPSWAAEEFYWYWGQSSTSPSRSNVSKLFHIVQVTISQYEFLLHTFWTDPKKIFRGHNVLQTSLVFLWIWSAIR